MVSAALTAGTAAKSNRTLASNRKAVAALRPALSLTVVIPTDTLGATLHAVVVDACHPESAFAHARHRSAASAIEPSLMTHAVLTPSPEIASPTAAPPALRMLYVEDDRINAMLFSAAVQLQGGFELRVAEDSEEALALVSDWTPDVLVLDAHLPDTNGFDLLQTLRQQPSLSRTPAFMCSADSMPADLKRAAEAGFSGYWTKPVEIARIVADIRRVMGSDSGLPSA